MFIVVNGQIGLGVWSWIGNLQNVVQFPVTLIILCDLTQECVDVPLFFIFF